MNGWAAAIGALVPPLLILALARLRAAAAPVPVLAGCLGGALLAGALFGLAQAVPALSGPVPVATRAFIHAALTEELGKFGPLLLLLRGFGPRWGAAWQARDALAVLALACAVAAGFAALENALALWHAAAPLAALGQRLTIALPAHLGYAAILALALARAPAGGPGWLGGGRAGWAAAGLAVAVLAHGLFDLAALGGLTLLGTITWAALWAVLAWAWMW